MKDYSFGAILDGIIAQSQVSLINGKILKQHLTSLVYSNSELGNRSLEKLKKLIPNLKEFSINNVQLVDCIVKRTRKSKKDDE